MTTVIVVVVDGLEPVASRSHVIDAARDQDARYSSHVSSVVRRASPSSRQERFVAKLMRLLDRAGV
jgi:hypothetical protein